jgi:hypothetical protein
MFMGVSPGKLKSKGANATPAAHVLAAFVKTLQRKILHCRPILVALLACVASCAVVVAAQEERPQITPGERKVPRKKDAAPRAVAVLRLAASGKASLVPVAILVGGKFWDATAYKADPVPMALEPGTVYEAERAGSSLGLFTINSALHSNSINVESPWIGTGSWLPAGSETPNKALKAETAPAGIDTSDQPPRLTRNPTKESPPAAPPSSPAPPSTPPSASGDEPPRLTKSAPPPSSAPSSGSTQPGQSQPGSSSTPPKTDPKAADTKPAEAKANEAKPDSRANLPASDSGADASGRPTLRRGKPVGPLPDDEVPGYSKPGAVASAASPANAGKVPDAAADKEPAQMVPAISDASGPEPRSFAFDWLKDEEGERRQQMTALAKEQVRAYVEARAKARITPKPAGPQTVHHTPATRAATKTKDPILENVQMKAYDLWTNNQPVLVFSAEAHMPPPPAGVPHSEVESELQYSIMLVAFPDTYNNLHKIYAGVTDKYHLDITPRLELVDAVDADGDRRGELLFHEISDGGNGWIIYRASQDKLWKMFDSLHPE